LQIRIFSKIIKSGFREYHIESVNDTFSANEYDSKEVLSIYKDCIATGNYIKPQFHGREHLNVRKFMNNISMGLKYDILGIEHDCLLAITEGGQVLSREYYHPQNYMAGFEALDKSHENEIEKITKNGFQMFEELFGMKSRSFVAQSLIWGPHLLSILNENGVRFIQGAQQFVPLGGGKLKVQNNFSGTKTIFGQTLWRRNASFEPSANENLDWADKCLKEISISFKWGAPAIINSHRVNYIGSVNPANRDNGLKQLDKLLSLILKNWPEVEFYASDELGDLMEIDRS
jgi:hypothetical protein